MWRVSGDTKKSHRFYSILKRYRERFETHCQEVNTANFADFEAVLDGQQRLTALYIGLKGTYGYKIKNLKWDNTEYAIPNRKLYLCLSENSIDQDDNEDGRRFDFKFLTNDELKNSDYAWFNVGDILNISGTFALTTFLKQRGWDSDKYITETLSALFDAIHIRPLINYYLETEQDYDKALNIFIRINSGGEKLSYSDLIMSTIISGWSSDNLSARNEFNNLIDSVWHATEIVIDKDLIIRTYLLIASEDIRFRVTNFDLTKAQDFKAKWPSIRDAITETINLVRSFGYVERTITSKNALLPIIHYLFISNRVNQFTSRVSFKEDRELIKKWFHAVLLKRIFGGSADTILKLIRDIVREEVTKGCTTFPIHVIAQKLSKTRKSITMEDEAIEQLLYTTYDDRYSFSILALLYPDLDYKNNNFNMDHVFPRSQFTQKNIKQSGVMSHPKANYYADGEMFNGIVNLQMLDSSENKSKSDKTYADWARLSSVDFEKRLLSSKTEFHQFPEFVDERWPILKKKLADALKF